MTLNYETSPAQESISELVEIYIFLGPSLGYLAPFLILAPAPT